jgi:hypothetical protein
MKHVTVSKRGNIRHIFDKSPSDQKTIIISDAEAAKIQKILDNNELPVLLNNRVTSRNIEREAGNILNWDVSIGELVSSSIPCPMSVSRRGLRKALLTIGIKFDPDIKSVIESIKDLDDRAIALIDFEEAQNIHRVHPLVIAIGNSLSKTEEEIDSLFILADKLDN